MVKRAALLMCFVALCCSTGWGANHTVPAGSVLNCRLSQTLTTKLNSPGQAFAATVSEPLIINGKEIIPVGATIQGRISSISRPGRIKGTGEMLLSPETIAFPGGQTYSLSAVLTNAYGAPDAIVADPEGLVKGTNPHTSQSELRYIGIGAGGGSLLGILAGGFHGALIGGAVGGAAGLFAHFAKHGPDVALPTGTELKFQLTHELVLKSPGIAEFSMNSSR